MQSSSTSDVESNSLLTQILTELKNSNSKNDNRLWDAEDIAYYMKLSKSSVQGRIVCKVSFPDPIKIPTNSGKTSPRWVAREVKMWVEKHRGKK